MITAVFAALACCAAAACGAEGPIVLRDVTAQTGITFRHTDGSSGQHYIVETISSGLALLDYDGDGRQDEGEPRTAGVTVFLDLNGNGALDAGESGIPGITVFHAGTKLENDEYYTNGGRVLDVCASEPTLAQTMENIYSAISAISFEGMHFRRDIGAVR